MSVIFTGKASLPPLSDSQLMHTGCRLIANFKMPYVGIFFLFHNKLFFSTQYDSNEKTAMFCSIFLSIYDKLA